VAAHIEQAANVWMGDAPRHVDFPFESFDGARAVRFPGMDGLERDLGVKDLILNLEDLAHAAAAQKALDLVTAPENVADVERTDIARVITRAPAAGAVPPDRAGGGVLFRRSSAGIGSAGRKLSVAIPRHRRRLSHAL